MTTARDGTIALVGAGEFLPPMLPVDKSLVERLKTSPRHGRDVHEDVPPAIIRLDEAVALFGIEEFHHTLLRHTAAPSGHRPQPRLFHSRSQAWITPSPGL